MTFKKILIKLYKSIFALIGTALLIAALIVGVKYFNADEYFNLTIPAVIIGCAFIGSTFPFKTAAIFKAKAETYTDEVITLETKVNKIIFIVAKGYSLLIGLSSLVFSIVVFINKPQDSQDHLALALSLLIIFFIFTFLGIFSKEKKETND